jgi:hypothetical protein
MLESQAKDIVRKHAALVTENIHFTPEGMRRFVNDELPDLREKVLKGKLSDETISDLIERASDRDPEQSRLKSRFRLLPKRGSIAPRIFTSGR